MFWHSNLRRFQQRVLSLISVCGIAAFSHVNIDTAGSRHRPTAPSSKASSRESTPRPWVRSFTEESFKNTFVISENSFSKHPILSLFFSAFQNLYLFLHRQYRRRRILLSSGGFFEYVRICSLSLQECINRLSNPRASAKSPNQACGCVCVTALPRWFLKTLLFRNLALPLCFQSTCSNHAVHERANAANSFRYINKLLIVLFFHKFFQTAVYISNRRYCLYHCFILKHKI